MFVERLMMQSTLHAILWSLYFSNKGITTGSKKLLGAPGLTRSRKLLRASLLGRKGYLFVWPFLAWCFGLPGPVPLEPADLGPEGLGSLTRWT